MPQEKQLKHARQQIEQMTMEERQAFIKEIGQTTQTQYNSRAGRVLSCLFG